MELFSVIIRHSVNGSSDFGHFTHRPHLSRGNSVFNKPVYREDSTTASDRSDDESEGTAGGLVGKIGHCSNTCTAVSSGVTMQLNPGNVLAEVRLR